MQNLLSNLEKGDLEALISNDSISNIKVKTTFSKMKTPGFCPCCGSYRAFSVPTTLELHFDDLYEVQIDMAVESDTRFGDSTDLDGVKADLDTIQPLAWMMSPAEYRLEWDSELSVNVITKSKELVEVLQSNYEVEVDEPTENGEYEVFVTCAYAEYLQDAVARMFKNPKDNQKEALGQIRQEVIAFAKDQVGQNSSEKAQRVEIMKSIYLKSKAQASA